MPVRESIRLGPDHDGYQCWIEEHTGEDAEFGCMLAVGNDEYCMGFLLDLDSAEAIAVALKAWAARHRREIADRQEASRRSAGAAKLRARATKRTR